MLSGGKSDVMWSQMHLHALVITKMLTSIDRSSALIKTGHVRQNWLLVMERARPIITITDVKHVKPSITTDTK